MAKRSKTQEPTPPTEDDVFGDIEESGEAEASGDVLGDIEVQPEPSIESAPEIEDVPPPKEAKPEPVPAEKVVVGKVGEAKLLGFEYSYVSRKRAVGRHCTPENQRAFLEEHGIDYDKVTPPTIAEGYDKTLGVFRPVKNQSKVAILVTA